MPKIAYIQRERGFYGKAVQTIERANLIIEEYRLQGYSLTLRQLYYQFVSRGWLPNTDREYSNLGSTINDARLAGLIDWNAIEDRTRNLRERSHWGEPEEIVRSAADSYFIDMWQDQAYRPEVWVEKDALTGVIAGVCEQWDVPWFSCRGYTSQSEVWGAAMRLKKHVRRGYKPVVIHLGDHDPSGIDMTRDIEDRMRLFMGSDAYALEVHRIALNMDQVRQYNPPPNPAKLTDSRGSGYIQVHGDESWELDALSPAVIGGLIRDTLDDLRDDDLWQARHDRLERERQVLTLISDRYDEVVDFLTTPEDDNDQA